MKENLLRIAEKVKEYTEKNRSKYGWRYLTDMIRATIRVDTLDELWEAYEWFKQAEECDEFQVLTMNYQLG